MGGATFYTAQVNVQEVWMGRQSTGRLGDCKHLLGSRWGTGGWLGQKAHHLWMKPGGCSWFWPPHRFKDNAQKKGNSLYLGFSEAQEESFLSKPQGLTKGIHPIKRIARREHSLRTGSAAGEQLELVARTFSHPREHGQVKALPSVLQVRSPELPHSRHLRAGK